MGFDMHKLSAWDSDRIIAGFSCEFARSFQGVMASHMVFKQSVCFFWQILQTCQKLPSGFVEIAPSSHFDLSSPPFFGVVVVRFNQSFPSDSVDLSLIDLNWSLKFLSQ